MMRLCMEREMRERERVYDVLLERRLDVLKENVGRMAEYIINV